MDTLFNLTQQYMPEFERLASLSKFTSKSKKTTLKKKKRRKPKNKVLNTVYKSMQAHVDRISLSNESNYAGFQRERLLPMPRLEKQFPAKLRSIPNTQKGQKPPAKKKRGSQTSTKSKSKKPKAKKSKNLRKKTSKAQAEKFQKTAKGSRTNSKKFMPPKTKSKPFGKEWLMQRNQFLNCLKSLQEELKSLKVPDFSILQEKAENRPPPPQPPKQFKGVSKINTNRDGLRRNDVTNNGTLSTYFSRNNETYEESEEDDMFAGSFGYTTQLPGYSGYPTITQRTGIRLEMNINPVDRKAGPSNFFEWGNRPFGAINLMSNLL